eukprot:TRINITY_DN780_c0_g1_i4.p1 TRINITY_DN780_c0_g1~~TRINITY_DN780_c0_g1_i4.p1  ORF type:complete len:1035 (-),score=180.70 TRINITY_DN780_c0_g1_i4:589-3693(-)
MSNHKKTSSSSNSSSRRLAKCKNKMNHRKICLRSSLSHKKISKKNFFQKLILKVKELKLSQTLGFRLQRRQSKQCQKKKRKERQLNSYLMRPRWKLQIKLLLAMVRIRPIVIIVITLLILKNKTKVKNQRIQPVNNRNRSNNSKLYRIIRIMQMLKILIQNKRNSKIRQKIVRQLPIKSELINKHGYKQHNKPKVFYSKNHKVPKLKIRYRIHQVNKKKLNQKRRKNLKLPRRHGYQGPKRPMKQCIKKREDEANLQREQEEKARQENECRAEKEHEDEIGQKQEDEIGQKQEDEIGQKHEDEIGQKQEDEIGQKHEDEIGQKQEDEIKPEEKNQQQNEQEGKQQEQQQDKHEQDTVQKVEQQQEDKQMQEQECQTDFKQNPELKKLEEEKQQPLPTVDKETQQSNPQKQEEHNKPMEKSKSQLIDQSTQVDLQNEEKKQENKIKIPKETWIQSAKNAKVIFKQQQQQQKSQQVSTNQIPQKIDSESQTLPEDYQSEKKVNQISDQQQRIRVERETWIKAAKATRQILNTKKVNDQNRETKKTPTKAGPETMSNHSQSISDLEARTQSHIFKHSEQDNKSQKRSESHQHLSDASHTHGSSLHNHQSKRSISENNGAENQKQNQENYKIDYNNVIEKYLSQVRVQQDDKEQQFPETSQRQSQNLPKLKHLNRTLDYSIEGSYNYTTTNNDQNILNNNNNNQYHQSNGRSSNVNNKSFNYDGSGEVNLGINTSNTIGQYLSNAERVRAQTLDIEEQINREAQEQEPPYPQYKFKLQWRQQENLLRIAQQKLEESKQAQKELSNYLKSTKSNSLPKNRVQYVVPEQSYIPTRRRVEQQQYYLDPIIKTGRPRGNYVYKKNAFFLDKTPLSYKNSLEPLIQKQIKVYENPSQTLDYELVGDSNPNQFQNLNYVYSEQQPIKSYKQESKPVLNQIIKTEQHITKLRPKVRSNYSMINNNIAQMRQNTQKSIIFFFWKQGNKESFNNFIEQKHPQLANCLQTAFIWKLGTKLISVFQYFETECSQLLIYKGKQIFKKQRN